MSPPDTGASIAATADLARPRRELHRERRRARRHVDHDAARTQRRQDAGPVAAVAEHDLLDLARVADHDEDHVARGRDRGGGVGPRRAGVDQRVGLRPGPRGHGDLVAGGEQVPAHARPHHPGPDPPDPSRSRRPWRDSGRAGEIVRSPDPSYTGHMLSDGTLVIDADSHFTERHDLFTELAPEKYKDRVPARRGDRRRPHVGVRRPPARARQRRRGDRQGRPEGERRPRAQPLVDRGHARRLVRPQGAARGARRVRHRRADHVPQHRGPRRPGPRHGRRRRRSASS